MTTLTVNYDGTHFSVESTGGAGNYPKGLFEVHKDAQSVFVRNSTQVNQMPFIILTNKITGNSYDNTVIVDGIAYAVDYTDDSTIVASFAAIAQVLDNAFNGLQSTPVNSFEFTSAPSIQDFETTMGFSLLFPIRTGTSISFWNIGYTIPNFAFFSNADLTSIALCEATSIGVSTFYGCPNLTTANIPKVQNVLTTGLASCPQLNIIDISGMLSIGAQAFYGDTNLPVNVFCPLATNVVSGAFIGASSVKTFLFPSAVQIGGGNVFQDCTSAISFQFGAALTALGDTSGNDDLFLGITGQTIAVTIPSYFQTNNGGFMDGDLAYLAANNTVNFNWI